LWKIHLLSIAESARVQSLSSSSAWMREYKDIYFQTKQKKKIKVTHMLPTSHREDNAPELKKSVR